MNWESELTDLFSDIPVLTAAAARGSARFSHLPAVSVVAGVECLGAVQLRRTALVK
jgi:hypothetical protein